MAISFLAVGARESRVLINLTLASGTTQFLSGEHDSIEAVPILEEVGDIGQEMDLRTRKITYSSTSVKFIDDGIIRNLLTTEPVFGQKLEIFLGTKSLAEGSFKKVFNGHIRDSEVEGKLISLEADDVRSMMKDRLLRARDFVTSVSDYIINRHPLQIMLAILEAVVPAANINTASFDPDNYATGSRAISHWNTARAVHGDFDRRVVEEESALGMLDELALLLDGAVIIDLDGVFKFVQFDPSATPVENFVKEDIRGFRQSNTFGNLVNKSTIFFNWKGKNDGGDVIARVPSGTFRRPSNTNDYVHTWNRVDADSQADYAHPDGPALRTEHLDIETKWVGVSSLLEFQHPPAATTITVIGGWASAFSGVDRILNGTSDGSVNSGLNSGDRKGFLLIEFPIPHTDGIFGFEIVSVDTATIDFLNEGHPSQGGDTDLVGIPIRVIFDILARGLFGTVANQTLPRNSLVTDITIPVARAAQGIQRFSNGLPTPEIDVDLQYADLELADFITAVEPRYLDRGKNGLTASTKLEVIGKSMRLLGDDKAVTIKFADAKAPAILNADDLIIRFRDFLEDHLSWDDEGAPEWDSWIAGGLEVFDPGGLFVGVRDGRVFGAHGPQLLSDQIQNIPAVASRDNYILYDSHTRMFNRIDTAVAAGAPATTKVQQFVAVIELGATVQVSRKDLRITSRGVVSPRMLFGANGQTINGTFSHRFRNSDRFPPDFIELEPIDSVWGAPGAAGNDLELATSAASVESGDVALGLLSAARGVRLGDIVAVEGGRPYLAEFLWRGPTGTDARGKIEWLAQDRVTVVSTDTVFDKTPTTVNVFERGVKVFDAPATARFARLIFTRGLSTTVATVNLDRWSLRPVPVTFHVEKTATQTITTGTFQKIRWNVFNSGPLGTVNYGSKFDLSPDELAVPVDSEWDFCGGLQIIAPSFTFELRAALFVNGASVKEALISVPSIIGTAGLDAGIPFCFLAVQLTKDDIVDLRIQQNSGVSTTLLPNTKLVYWAGRETL